MRDGCHWSARLERLGACGKSGGDDAGNEDQETQNRSHLPRAILRCTTRQKQPTTLAVQTRPTTASSARPPISLRKLPNLARLCADVFLAKRHH